LSAWFLLLICFSPTTDPDLFAVEAWDSLARAEPLTRAFAGSAEAGREARARLLTEMGFGPVIGFKAALTSRPAQQRFGTRAPILGILLAGMIRRQGEPLPSVLGAIPVIEADLMVRVGDPSLVRAETRAQALAGLDAVFPFLEIPDLTYAPGLELSAPALIAINAGARSGVLGAPIALDGTGDWVGRLAEFRVSLSRDAELLGEGTGAALLGHPLDAVLWLCEALRAEGIRLERGQLLSLGSLTRPFPLGEATRVRLRYEGLDPDGPVTLAIDLTRREP